jgi:hypothetical protein
MDILRGNLNEPMFILAIFEEVGCGGEMSSTANNSFGQMKSSDGVVRAAGILFGRSGRLNTRLGLDCEALDKKPPFLSGISLVLVQRL